VKAKAKPMDDMMEKRMLMIEGVGSWRKAEASGILGSKSKE
jgi:hypothetical protein